MIFLGTTFFSGKYTLSPPVTNNESVSTIRLSDGTYNHLFVSSDTSLNADTVTYDWNYDTKMSAPFDENLHAGNSEFSTKTTDNIVIKRREIGTQKWTVISVKEIHTAEDFDINIKDTYARSGVEYEYCVSSYINGIENSYVIETVYSEFDGYYITDKDCIYGTIYDVDGCDTSRNMAAQTLNLLNSKYMTVVSNSSLDCDSGSITGNFFKLDKDHEYNQEQSLQYREDFKKRLTSKKPLILKIDDGRIWMVRTSASPNDAQNGHRNIRSITFEWVEIGDYNDMETLYYAGLSDVDSRWW